MVVELLVFRLRAQVVVVVVEPVVVSPTAAAAVAATATALLVGEGRVLSVESGARSQHRRERVVCCGGLRSADC
ncbi:hypothetical protein AB0J37_24775 [Microbispora rosea]|uniref:hypothetical protein n=1 Tax=Microbispora rosea TaxID=58117 RepID=UPI003428932E